MASTGEPFGLFWDSENRDRTYSAASFEYWLKKFFTSGVFNGDLQVQATSGMTVKVGAGYANVDGKVKFWNAEFNLTLSAANSTYPRIDTIVITRDNVNRQITCEVVTGAYTADEPQPTAPVRNPEIYQLVLAQIYVAAGATGVTQSDITDTRTDTDLCGYITGTVTEMDFSQFTAQFEAYFAEYKLGFEADMSEWESSQQASYATWFNSIVQQYISDKSDWDSWYADLQATLHMLPQDSAEYLQVEINELRDLSSGSIINIDTIEPTLIGQAVTLSSEDGLQTKSAVFEKYRNKLENEGESETINGITFTVNADGTVTANGTASAEARFYINESFTAANGDVLNGCPENGSAVSYQLRVGTSTDDTAVGIDVGSGYTMSAGTYKISINIASGRTVNNLVFKPMVRDAADSDEYEKYSSAKAHATIKGVTFVGNLKLASTDSIYTAKATLNTPYYSLYHVDMVFWIANVDIQGDTTLYGATVTVKDSDDVTVGTVTLSSLDGTGSIELTKPDTYTFNYSYLGVDYSVSQVVDTDGATYSLNLYTWRATVNLDGDSELVGVVVTVTDSNSQTVGTVTLDSNGDGVFIATVADTYTFSFSYDGDSYSEQCVVSAETTYSVMLNVSIELTVYSASNDTVQIYDNDLSSWVTLCSTDSSGESTATVRLKQGEYQLKSSVAKNPDNLSNDYTKNITITKSTTTIYLMPDGHIGYWYGYIDLTLVEDTTTANGWPKFNNQYTYVGNTKETNRLKLNGTSSTFQGIGTTQKITASKVYSILQNTTGGANLQTVFHASKGYSSQDSPSYNSTSINLATKNNVSDKYASIVAYSGASLCYVFAFWWED